MNDSSLPDDLKNVAAALRTLTPAAVELDRDRLMFAAGRADVKRSLLNRSVSARFLWQLSTAALLLLSLILGWRLNLAGEQPERIVYVERTIAPQIVAQQQTTQELRESLPPDAQSYLLLRERVLAGGVESLPGTTGGRVTAFANVFTGSVS